MFDKIKDLNNFRKAQSEIKKQLEQMFHSEEKRGTKVIVRGDKRIEKIEIDGEEDKELKDLINDAMKKMDKKAEKQLRGKLKGLGLPDL
ncbi:YbaB/EbfC family nucleoid-associated protein [Patescibacteria group bacterium]|nr:YbaB/EbfC family nucleoid-associated protein [Patescibacteria group bacterium]